MPNLSDCRELLTTATSAGATVPTALADLLINHDKLAAAVDDHNRGPSPLEALTAAVTSGTALDDKTAAAIVAEQAARLAAFHAGVGAFPAVTQATVTAFGRALHTDAGDDLVLSLRPAFDRAVTGLHDAAALFGPETTPAQILDLGDAAATAWRALPAHRTILDRTYQLTSWSLSSVWRLTGPRDYVQPQQPHLAWILDGAHRNDVAAAAEVFFRSNASSPGGRWHALIAAGFRLRLNTPSEARDLLDAYEQAQADQTEHVLERTAHANGLATV